LLHFNRGELIALSRLWRFANQLKENRWRRLKKRIEKRIRFHDQVSVSAIARIVPQLVNPGLFSTGKKLFAIVFHALNCTFQ